MAIPFILCVILLVMGRDELDVGWVLGIIAFLLLAGVMCFFLNIYPIAFVVPLVLVDILLILKVFGGDITIR